MAGKRHTAELPLSGPLRGIWPLRYPIRGNRRTGRGKRVIGTIPGRWRHAGGRAGIRSGPDCLVLCRYKAAGTPKSGLSGPDRPLRRPGSAASAGVPRPGRAPAAASVQTRVPETIVDSHFQSRPNIVESSSKTGRHEHSIVSYRFAEPGFLVPTFGRIGPGRWRPAPEQTKVPRPTGRGTCCCDAGGPLTGRLSGPPLCGPRFAML